MLVIPVLDLLNGVVVRGVGGRRDEYRPVQSVLTSSVLPRDVAQAFQKRLGLTTLYVADLDALLHQQPNADVCQQLASDGFELWIDAGVRSVGCPIPCASRHALFRPRRSGRSGARSWGR